MSETKRREVPPRSTRDLPLPTLPPMASRAKLRSYEEWKALARWNRLPTWEPLRPGFALRAAREAAKVTQADLAARLGVSQQAVAQAERANSNPTIAFVASWARALGTTFSFALAKLHQSPSQAQDPRLLEPRDLRR